MSRQVLYSLAFFLREPMAVVVMLKLRCLLCVCVVSSPGQRGPGFGEHFWPVQHEHAEGSRMPTV